MNVSESGNSFEYDNEGVEAVGDEGFTEYEGYNEDEASDGEDEASDGEDESAYAMTEDASETDEAQDSEDAGEDEDVGEAVFSASAQLQAVQAAQRQRMFQNRLVADQRAEKDRALATQRSLTSQIRSVQAGGPTRVASAGSLQGAGVVTAILPNGRRSRMRIIPTVAPIAEVNRLKSVMAVNDRRQAVAMAKNSRAISALAVAQATAVKKLTTQQVQSDKDLGKRILEGHNRLDKRITKELSGGSGSLDKHGKRMMRLLKRQRQRSIMNGVLLATSAPFFAAYGERDNPFGTKNLILTGSVLGYMLGDELIDSFAGGSKGARGVATTWSYVAPVANGLTAFFAFRNKQNERFVSSIAVVKKGEKVVTVKLKEFVKKGSFSDFAGQSHAVAANVIGATEAIHEVDVSDDRTELKITLAAAAAADTKVAWVLDTYATATAVTAT
jgi:hypothetical protein